MIKEKRDERRKGERDQKIRAERKERKGDKKIRIKRRKRIKKERRRKWITGRRKFFTKHGGRETENNRITREKVKKKG